MIFIYFDLFKCDKDVKEEKICLKKEFVINFRLNNWNVYNVFSRFCYLCILR